MNIPRYRLNKNGVLPQIPTDWGEIAIALATNKELEINDEKIESLELNDNILHSVLSIALRYQSYPLIKKCQRYIAKKSKLIFYFDDLRKIHFIYHSEGESLAKIDNEYINPLIQNFKNSIGVSLDSHEFELNLYKEDLSDMRNFIENHGEQISKLEIGGDERLCDNHLIHLTEYCKKLKNFEIAGFQNMTNYGLSFIQQLPFLEIFSLSSCLGFESVELKDIQNLRVLEFYNLVENEEIKIANLYDLKRLEISKCPELVELFISNCPNLEEIVIFECPKLELNYQNQIFHKLKFLSINNKIIFKEDI